MKPHALRTLKAQIRAAGGIYLADLVDRIGQDSTDGLIADGHLVVWRGTQGPDAGRDVVAAVDPGAPAEDHMVEATSDPYGLARLLGYPADWFADPFAPAAEDQRRVPQRQQLDLDEHRAGRDLTDDEQRQIVEGNPLHWVIRESAVGGALAMTGVTGPVVEQTMREAQSHLDAADLAARLGSPERDPHARRARVLREVAFGIRERDDEYVKTARANPTTREP